MLCICLAWCWVVVKVRQGDDMPSGRRIGAPDAKNRGVLLDAAEQLMLEEGYAAVTSRRLADRAGLKPQLVHYYFRTMDDLFLAVFRRRAEQGLKVAGASTGIAPAPVGAVEVRYRSRHEPVHDGVRRVGEPPQVDARRDRATTPNVSATSSGERWQPL